MSLLLKPGAKVLFQGDSITDCGRARDNACDLGRGYANFIASWILAKHPDTGLDFVNRGIGGDRIYDLETRWTEDCILLQPDLISILVGINDTWRRYDRNIISSVSDFEAAYRRILDRVRTETTAKLIILEPFLLHVPAERGEWREDLDPRIEAVRKIATDYDAVYISLDNLFAEAAQRREPAFWAADGVHPTQPGHALIAQAWLSAVDIK